MKLNDFFDKIFVINLTRRPDRLENFKKISEKIGFEYEIFPAVDGKCLDRNSLVEGRLFRIESNDLYKTFDDYFLGQLGCILSHLRLLKHCRDNNIRNVLILEDDVDFSDEFQSRFDNFTLNFNQEWHMIYFSGSLVETSDVFNSYSKLLTCHTTHSYAVNSSIYDYLIEKLDSEILSKPVDVVYSQLHSSIKSWIVIPFFTYQYSCQT
jgi:GR25 family glycosyltransferase involved in LPS biosynthesis